VILYLDTSALVKLYVLEVGSAQVAQAVADAEVVSTCLIAYVEARSALARKCREDGFPPNQYTRLLQEFEADWGNYFAVTLSPYLMRAAGALAKEHGLRARDSLHLASANLVKDAAGAPVTFMCADQRLAEAARAVGLEAIVPLGP